MSLTPFSMARFWYVTCESEKEDPFFGDKTDCVEKNITIDLRAYDSY